MKKEKLIAIINDLQADNQFNEDKDSKRNISIDIDNLMKELKITQDDIKKYSEVN